VELDLGDFWAALCSTEAMEKSKVSLLEKSSTKQQTTKKKEKMLMYQGLCGEE